MRVTPQRDPGLGKALRKESIVLRKSIPVYLMSGGYDIMVLMEGESLREVALFVAQKLSSIDGVISTATHFVLKNIRTRGYLLTEKRIPIEGDSTNVGRKGSDTYSEHAA